MVVVCTVFLLIKMMVHVMLSEGSSSLDKGQVFFVGDSSDGRGSVQILNLPIIFEYCSEVAGT